MDGWELGLFILTALMALISVATITATPSRQSVPVKKPRGENHPRPPRRAA